MAIFRRIFRSEYMRAKRGFKNIILSFGILMSSITMGQGYKAATEIGVFGGGSYYIGDLNPNQHFVFSKPAFGLIYRYNLSTRHSIRATALYGNIFGDDARAKQQSEQNRNLSFKSKVLELAIGYEIDLFKYSINDMKYPISPYFFYQIAYTRINPTTEFNGNDIALQPLGTEGQGTSLSTRNRYSLNQIAIPLGIGVKINLRKRLAISLEYGVRKTFTDFLDDVSGNFVDSEQLRIENGPLAADLSDRSINDNGGINRGNPNNKDWYTFYGLHLTFKPFKRSRCPSDF